MTGNKIYREKVEQIRDTLKNAPKPKGLYPNYLNPKNGLWTQRKYEKFIFMLYYQPCLPREFLKNFIRWRLTNKRNEKIIQEQFRKKNQAISKQPNLKE